MRLRLLAAVAVAAAAAYACVGEDPFLRATDEADAAVSAPQDAAEPPRDAIVEAAAADSGVPCEADLATNAENCGRCGHSCLGGGCDAGTCSPVVLVDEPVQVPAFAVSGDRVFWSSWDQAYDGGARSELRGCTLPDCAGTTRTLAAAGGGPDVYRNVDEVAFGMAADATHVYAPAYYHSRVLRCPVAGCADGGPELFATTLGAPREIVLDEDTVYWISENDGPRACAKVGCTAERGLIAGSFLAADRPSDRIAVDATHVYFGSRADPQGFYSVPKGSSDAGASAFLPGRELPKSIATNDEAIFVAYWGSAEGLTTGKIERQPRGGVAGVIATGLPQPSSLLVDGKTLYFTGFSDGTVRRCPTANCTAPAAIAEGQENLQYLRQDAVSLYWNNRQSGQIVRLAK